MAFVNMHIFSLTFYILTRVFIIDCYLRGVSNKHCLLSLFFIFAVNKDMHESSFLQLTRTCMKAWMSLDFSKFATELRPLIDVRI